MSSPESLHLFQAFGVELEYMIVDAKSLDVRPITDRVLEAVAGEITSDFDAGTITWSNELTAHVIELKTSDPAPTLDPLPQAFQESVSRINAVLQPMGARLMPSAMHPWMDPHRELVLWPHDNSSIYEAFNRIFDCRGHGWANLQAVHLNLPFTGDAEFARLHAAIRVLLPILPALAASSPLMDGRPAGLLDARLSVYQQNCRRIPAASGRVIPEAVFSSSEYHRLILEPLYADVAPFDAEGVLQEEWLNSRGAIARFERNTIEVRVLDVQECPQADVAICALIADVLEALAAGRWGDPARLESWETETLYDLLQSAIRDADRALIGDAEYRRLFGLEVRETVSAADLWKHLAEAVGPNARSQQASVRPAVLALLKEGPLASRILSAVGTAPSRDRIAAVYRQLCDCLAGGRMFVGLE
ncbi:MAG TPA: glutamate-cysteine ligase family protein [Planctomycetaceae bacterium]|jgi:carboxylate-amine ligase|nr:glutamate-cysteine ligase family protein [Planctomycetaceae bacterium]